MSIFIVFALIVVFALSITLFTNFKALESTFLATMIIVIELILLLYNISLSTSVYIICGIIAVCFMSSIVYSLINKSFLSRVKSFFFNPAFILLIISVVSYSIAIQGAMLLSWDNFSHWARATKAILVYDGLQIPNGIIYAHQLLELPIYYSFVAYFTGFSYDALLSAMWWVYWIVLLLPFAKTDFNKTPRILLFAMIAFSLLLSDYKAYTQLYADTIISTVFTGIVCYYFLNKDSKAKNIIILLGIAFLSQTKYGLGVIFSVFILMIILFDIIYKNKWKLNKNNITFTSTSIITIFLSYLYSKHLITTSKVYEEGFVNYNSLINGHLQSIYGSAQKWCTPIDSIINALKSPIGITLISILIILAAYIIIKLIIKKKVSLPVWIFLGIAAVALIGYVFINLDSGSYLLLSEFFKHVISVKFLDIELLKLVLITAGLCFLMYQYIYKDKAKKQYIVVLSIVLLAQIIMILTATVYRYSEFPIHITQTGNSIERYVGIYVYFVLYSLAIIVTYSETVYKLIKRKSLAYILTAIIILITIYPAPLQIYNQKAQSQQQYIDNGFSHYAEDSAAINDILTKDDKLCILVDKINTDGGQYVSSIVSFFTLTPASYVLSPDYTKNVEAQTNAISQFIKSNSVTKVYVVGCYSTFFEEFAPLFDDNYTIETDTLYEVVWQNDDTFLLVPDWH